MANFARDGFLVVRDVVGPDLLARLDDEVAGVVACDPPPPDRRGKHFYFLGPDRLPASADALVASGGLRLAEQLTSPYELAHSYGHIQIALNIPRWDHVPGGPHLDGYHDPRRPHPFTILAAIFLGDESRPDAGNLWVWPGSHLAHADLFRRDGVLALMDTGGHATMTDPPLELGPPIAVMAKRGDLFLGHYLLGHNSGGNTTTETRRAIYYRLGVAEHEDRWRDALVDPFFDFPSLRSAGGR